MGNLMRGITLYIFSFILLFGGFGSVSKPKFLQPSEAFKVEVNKSNGFLDINISLGEKIHIYSKDLYVKVIEPKEFEVEINKPKATKYEGDEVYYGKLRFSYPS